MDIFQQLSDWFKRLFGGQPVPPTPPPPPVEPTGQKPEPVTRKAWVIAFDPPIPSQGGRRLSQVMGWHAVEDLVQRYCADLLDCSRGYLTYQVVETTSVDSLPVKEDGFFYDPDLFLEHLRSGSGFHTPDAMDYSQVLQQFSIVDRVQRGEVDEVWLFGPPYAGFYESRMAGSGAFFCNAPPLPQDGQGQRRFIIMGFNYERGVGEMLESFSHRAEFILHQVFRAIPAEANLWERFIRYERSAPGQAEVGTVHFAPNSERDYDWGNHHPVQSRCDTWYHFPDLAGTPRLVECSEWGGGDMRQHHLWWLRHFPCITGSVGGIAFNWWKYVVDPDQVQ